MSLLKSMLAGDVSEQKQVRPAGEQRSHILFLLNSEKVSEPSGRFAEQAQSNFRYLQRKLIASPEHVRAAVEINSRIKHGNPVFKGTRVPLYVVIEELADGSTIEDIIEGYPTIDAEQVRAGLDFVSSLTRIYDD